jgi:hypothetical protein
VARRNVDTSVDAEVIAGPAANGKPHDEGRKPHDEGRKPRAEGRRRTDRAAIRQVAAVRMGRPATWEPG